MQLFDDVNRGAEFSTCKKYRYKLWRIWDTSKPLVLFIMCNPSTADSQEDDPTIKRCISFAKSWGYGGFYVGNLFAYISTKPDQLLNMYDPIGTLNTKAIMEMSIECSKIVTAWGNGRIVDAILKKNPGYKPLPPLPIYYIDLSKHGHPKHPLFLKSDLKPKSFTSD